MDKLTWVIQKNMFNEAGYDKLVSTIERMGFPHISVKVIPFTEEMEPPVTKRDGLVAYGSTSLSKIAIKQKWFPGVFFNEKLFTAQMWNLMWGKEMLNYHCNIVAFKDISIPKGQYRFFIRPVDDFKTFSGCVVYSDEFHHWQEKVMALEASTLSPWHECVVAPVQRIMREYRFFVVGGKVITGSMYKMGENVISKPEVDPYIWDYAQAMVDHWQPADGFVIDIAMLEDNILKIIEVNCLNSSGFYACDTSKIVQAVSDYYENYDDSISNYT